ncbi:uncharacterized protein LOC111350480 isoform X1 [Spodoptera litura]|uniref:Uncharacterized protein LOC111350480 isoform X1 n=1 Tax=Spodoptera litura TaxID=69820 RepID=A0A9J7DSW0_SPOLT|nr:uncharacterized protein LOC111350480 isoform X1 [Spodoptera litura]
MNVERTSHPSVAQVEWLVGWLERKPSLAKGFAKTPSGRLAASHEWDRITLRLNSIRGTLKSKKQWLKYWADKKSAVKKKAAARAAFISSTGMVKVEEGETPPQLSNIEERILVLMGGEAFIAGNRLLQNIKVEPSQDSGFIRAPVTQSNGTCHSLRVVPPNNLLGPTATEAEVTTTSDPLRLNDSFIINITIPPPTPAVQDHQQQSVLARSDTEQPMSPGPPATRPALSRLTSPTRSRRRILQGIRRRRPVSPSLQRRNNLLDMTDKFLQIEHRRLEIDNRMVTVMERNSERDHLLVEATKTMGEGLKAMAEGLKALAEAIKR